MKLSRELRFRAIYEEVDVKKLITLRLRKLKTKLELHTMLLMKMCGKSSDMGEIIKIIEKAPDRKVEYFC